MCLQSIVHPTDFSDFSVDAFVHALRIALAAKTKLYLLHVETGHQSKWWSLPHVRYTLGLWKLMTEDMTEKHPQAAIEAKLGIRVVKVSLDRRDPVHGILVFSTGIRPASSCSRPMAAKACRAGSMALSPR
jgi:hypothetical protein